MIFNSSEIVSAFKNIRDDNNTCPDPPSQPTLLTLHQVVVAGVKHGILRVTWPSNRKGNSGRPYYSSKTNAARIRGTLDVSAVLQVKCKSLALKRQYRAD
ncbi:hypothetical protein EMCG_06408 [[Emmonsia] crescens]|uniref:Uncharacterized protein n=1 Tax=[Emmonsia] crescens TaxID=73230 RepID=A0A0G2J6S3_9EURO|nr:hypothetical protein EMCG_06408 [Emmonsia crescens UAMH 3008]